MAGMDAAPAADLGDLGWFAVSWLVMMAAMMLPSLVPAALAFARVGERTVAAFVVGYLAAWTAAGLAAYVLFETVRSLGVMNLTWMVAVAALIAAEQLLPWRTPATYGVAATLALLAIWMAVAPGDLPGLTLPGSMEGM